MPLLAPASQAISNSSGVVTPRHDTPASTTRSPSVPQIRHASRAHIRGKIRRIWRPRYLELYDNGLVRYYELPATADIAWNSGHDQEHVNMIPKYTLAIYHARILDATTIRDIHVGLPRGTYGFLFRGQRLMHFEEAPLGAVSPTACSEAIKEQRDFLCAVSSLEEAQMWVVALQWAAEQLKERPLPTEPWWHQEWEDPSISVADTASLASSVRSPKRSKHLIPSESPFRSKPPADVISTGKVVVSKVVQYRVVRVSTFTWEIAYEIHGMVLRQRNVEKWILLRTADDFRNLISDLCKELGPSLLDRAQLGPIRQLPRLRDRPNPAALVRSVSVVDSILRSLVLDASMVNATSMKSFLGLSNTNMRATQSLSSRWYNIHNAAAVMERVTERMPDRVGTDQYVRDWFQQRGESNANAADMYAGMFLQRPWMFLGGLSLSTLAAIPISRAWQQTMPIVSLRLDYLLLSWAGAAVVGSMYPLSKFTGLLPPPSNNKGSTFPSKPPLPKKGSVAPRHSPAKVQITSGIPRNESHDSEVLVKDEADEVVSTTSVADGEGDDDTEGEAAGPELDEENNLSSPLPHYPGNDGMSCWSEPPHDIFHVRGINYLKDRVKVPSDAPPLTCRGVDVWLTDNPQRHIARHPAVLGGKLAEEDTFLVNFLLPFGNFVAYFGIPPISKFPKKLKPVWTKFLKGDQQYRDARLKLLPVVVEGPWIVKAAVGPGKSPALLGKVIPLQYFFRDPERNRKGVYEVDVIITASTIAKGILSVVKGHTKSVTIAFAFIIEAAEQDELPETALCTFQVHSLHLEDCSFLPDCNLDEIEA